MHEKSIVIDGQGVAVLLPVALVPQPPRGGKPHLDRALASGLTAMNVTMGILGIGMGQDSFRALLNTMHGYFSYFELEPCAVLVRTGDDIRRAKRDGRLGIIFGVQGLATKIEDDPNLLLILYRLGLRVAQITYNDRSSLGSGALDSPDTGLTQFGRLCIREMNHIGMCVDLAHAGERTMLEAIDASAAPVIVSHANARALCDTPRNASDAALKTLAAHGGVIGITAYAPFCETKPGARPRLDDFIDHVAHVANLVGIDHVGIGSDFFEAESAVRFERFLRARYPEAVRGYSLDTVYVDGFSRIDHLPRLAPRMLARGFSAADVQKVLGANFLRVFDRVWKD
ncbi:MAG: dipeptidase [Alphaproteobacteria bacterium]